ncbi:glycosyltransferase family 2 protein [Paracoccus ravus]|uniref:glycosyltransferase family 2 protein n=1 Tax=Paracoccus ravus TaxID=2447760 RepID=UPI00106E0503|nr:glycosyltransferase family 2 protein [Paracoccus ravus]
MNGGAEALSASVVIVSRHRPLELSRCLAALTRQDHPCFEVVLVADPDAVGTRPDLDLKRVSFDLPNISAARNAGLARAAGEIVLFIDDDAVAGPGWVRALCAPFVDLRVVAATGFTRGPDGLSWQVRAERITPSGRCYPIELTETRLLPPERGNPVSTLGTNCAFRRSSLVEIGGFDPAFAYHLDESDVNMRLARHRPDGLTAVVPAAEVVHGLAPGASRAAVGVPHDLRAIGRSTCFFAARHGGSVAWLADAQRKRLLRQMVAGRLDPFRVAPILASLEQGMNEARSAGPPPVPIWDRDEPPPLLPISSRRASALFLSGWHWQAARLRERAARAVADGQPVAIILFSPSFLPHRRVLRPEGWWEQVGGVWGSSLPGDPTVMLLSREQRAEREYVHFAALQR